MYSVYPISAAAVKSFPEEAEKAGLRNKKEHPETFVSRCSGAEGGIWTLARVFKPPTPLAGEPLRPLGYFCMVEFPIKSGGESGIRTHGCFHIAGFQDRCFQPLSHLSVRKAYSIQTQIIYYHALSHLSRKRKTRNLKKSEKKACIFKTDVLF